MKLGMNTAIMEKKSLEEVIALAASLGLESLETACWPVGKADRRYAGVTHIDVDCLDEEEIERINIMLREKKITIDSLSYSPNPLTEDEKLREAYFSHIKKLISAAEKLGVKCIDTFIGKNHKVSIEENMELFRTYWPEIIQYAEEKNVVVTFENCPMYFTKDEWPGGKNLAVSPKIWRQMFEIIDSPNFGMTYDPSHLAWQRMDYIKPIYEFKDKIFNVHIKDTKFYQEKYDDVGYFAHPLEYHAPKIPGYGDIEWGKVISALSDVGFSGSAFIEIEDRAFENSQEDMERAVAVSTNYMRQFL